MKEDTIVKFTDEDRITNETSEFYETEGGFLGLKQQGKDTGRVNAYRMFPLTKNETYISIIDKDKKEMGIIKSLSDIEPIGRAAIQKELAKRYFFPEITKIIDIKEEFNYTFFKVETTSGYREITVFDMNVSVHLMESDSILITDIDGNKYIINDLPSKGKKALRYLEIWL